MHFPDGATSGQPSLLLFPSQYLRCYSEVATPSGGRAWVLDHPCANVKATSFVTPGAATPCSHPDAACSTFCVHCAGNGTAPIVCVGSGASCTTVIPVSGTRACRWCCRVCTAAADGSA